MHTDIWLRHMHARGNCVIICDVGWNTIRVCNVHADSRLRQQQDSILALFSSRPGTQKITNTDSVIDSLSGFDCKSGRPVLTYVVLVCVSSQNNAVWQNKQFICEVQWSNCLRVITMVTLKGSVTTGATGTDPTSRRVTGAWCSTQELWQLTAAVTSLTVND